MFYVSLGLGFQPASLTTIWPLQISGGPQFDPDAPKPEFDSTEFVLPDVLHQNPKFDPCWLSPLLDETLTGWFRSRSQGPCQTQIQAANYSSPYMDRKWCLHHVVLGSSVGIWEGEEEKNSDSGSEIPIRSRPWPIWVWPEFVLLTALHSVIPECEQWAFHFQYFILC